jgi:flagellar basal body-associated protein FliL
MSNDEINEASEEESDANTGSHEEQVVSLKFSVGFAERDQISAAAARAGRKRAPFIRDVILRSISTPTQEAKRNEVTSSELTAELRALATSITTIPSLTAAAVNAETHQLFQKFYSTLSVQRRQIDTAPQREPIVPLPLIAIVPAFVVFVLMQLWHTRI